MNSLILFYLFACLAVTFVVGEKQRIDITGRLKCNGRPYSGAKLKLYDHDTFTLDDKLAQTTSDGDGRFFMSGIGSEITTMKSHFNIYHRCGKTLPVCYYKIKFDVPTSAINSGRFDAGEIELTLYPKHRDCLN